MSTKSTLTDNFTRALNYYISASGKTKKEIADAIKVPPTTFSSWTTGRHLPDMEKLQALSEYLGAPISQFYEFTVIVEKQDPLLEEIMQLFPQLSNEDKLLVRAVAVRILQLYGEK
jgi:transcriptional regulator with XRE-family HTH domain